MAAHAPQHGSATGFERWFRGSGIAAGLLVVLGLAVVGGLLATSPRGYLDGLGRTYGPFMLGVAGAEVFLWLAVWRVLLRSGDDPWGAAAAGGWAVALCLPAAVLLAPLGPGLIVGLFVPAALIVATRRARLRRPPVTRRNRVTTRR